MKILLLGSNPSIVAASNTAFTTDTASGRTLQSWIRGINRAQFSYENVLTQKTEGNRALSKAELQKALPDLENRIKAVNPDRIVALGKTAQSAMKELVVRGVLRHGHVLDMPHPSGRNRQLNDAEYMEEKLEELRAFCVNWDRTYDAFCTFLDFIFALKLTSEPTDLSITDVHVEDALRRWHYESEPTH